MKIVHPPLTATTVWTVRHIILSWLSDGCLYNDGPSHCSSGSDVDYYYAPIEINWRVWCVGSAYCNGEEGMLAHGFRTHCLHFFLPLCMELLNVLAYYRNAVSYYVHVVHRSQLVL